MSLARSPPLPNRPQAAPPGSELTPGVIDALLRASADRDLETLFWSSIWPQLEAAGWAALPGAAAGAPVAFLPPGAAEGQPAALAGVRAALQHLQAHPQLLPQLGAAPLLAPEAPFPLLSVVAEDAAAAAPLPPGVKACANCGTTVTPLVSWCPPEGRFKPPLLMLRLLSCCLCCAGRLAARGWIEC